MQYGVRYNYREPMSMEVGEEREFGCDTYGEVYHKNNPEWLTLTHQATSGSQRLNQSINISNNRNY